jgi:predicted ATPase/signal transduction histidine kinase
VSDGVGEVLPGRDLPLRAEILHESERTRIARLSFADRAVICKEPLGPDGESRLRHEVAVLERLRGVAGVAQLTDPPGQPGSIALIDAGSTSLAGLAKPLAAGDLIRLAVQLARAVAGMHNRGVMHRDITPANIVISRGGDLCVIDFALATSVAEIRPDFTHHTEILGTLAYLAPEQTGRTGRPVDQRADLYALGATLYELATGEPPFGSGDPLRLTHDHLARVPVPAAEVNPAVPGPLSDIILHLLEKEPDNRYQTADGLMYDLEQLQDAQTHTGATALRVGEHDFPVRLLPPSRLVGRDDEMAVLRAGFADAKSGRCRGVLVSGAAGVGKTALVDELRPVVTGSDGWFVVGKFDQYRRHLEFDAVHQAVRALGRLLLAEPEDELAKLRGRIVRAVGPNTGLLTATVPEFAALLAVPADPGDPLTAQLRTQRAIVELLRAVSTPQRPVVLFVDDLQWAGRTPLGVVDLVFSEERVEGLLLAGAYRDDDVDAAHPLASMVSRWRQQEGLHRLRLENLPASGSVTMVAEMLHVEPAAAAGLADAINPYTQGNPYETVELLNALRRDGVLAATAGGWRWDDAAVPAHLGRSEVGGLLAASVEAMPPTSQAIVEAMACLGGRAERRLLQTALAEPASVVEQMLAPALSEGLLVVEPGAHQAVRFRHDRTREVIMGALGPERQAALQLAMARRLAAVPQLFAVAAEQYLAVVDAVVDAAERRQVVGLLRRAAEQATLTGDYSPMNALLTAALWLIEPGDTAALIEVHTGRHAALYGMGRLEEADEEYRTIETLCTTATERAEATVVQVLSLTHRTRLADAIGFGLDSLRELGITVPSADRLPAELDQQFEHLYRWLDHTEAADDLARPDITEPGLIGATRVINAILPPTFFVADHATNAWLCLETLRIWRERGPGRTLVGPASTAAFATVTQRGDYAAGYRAARRILALGEARGYEPDTSQARFYFSVLCCWFEPVENSVHEGRRARDGLIAGGDLANAGYCWQSIVAGLLDCVLSLDTFLAEVESGLAFARRTGSEQSAQWLDSYRWLVGMLRGESAGTGIPVPIDTYISNPLALLFAHITRALAAEFLGDAADLARHTGAAMPLLPIVSGHYVTGVAHLLRGLALAGQARITEGGEERGELLSELQEVTQWLAARATNAPANFLHMLRLLEAERSWAVGDFQAAALAFDAARREAGQRQRPWHRALIAEHAGRFYLAHGLEHTGYDLLAQARQNYLAWGATAKVDQLDWAYPTLRLPADATAAQSGNRTADLVHRRSTVTTGTIDLLGILSGSQALSSETSIEGLHARVVEVLSAMTGATGVHLLLWSDDQQDWLLPTPGAEAGTAAVTSIGHERAVPMSVLRSTQRMRKPLVVADATRDERFARDPYFTDVDCCSLLAVPIQTRGAPRAVLLLENRLMRGAFTTERLDGVKLIAGQLAVSLDNAQLYAEFRRIADEQAALRRVATLVARGVEPSEVFGAVTDEMRRCTDAMTAGLWRFETTGELTLLAAAAADPALLAKWPVGTRTPIEGNTLASTLLRTGRPARMDDYENVTGSIAERVRNVGVRAAVGVPIIVDGRLWGLAAVGSIRPGPMPADTEAHIGDFADLVATAIANAATRAELIASRARIVSAADDARRRLERNLHDGAQQRLVSLGLALRMAESSVAADQTDLQDKLSRISSGLTGVSEDLREIARGIHPAILSKGGLGPALKTLARRCSVPVVRDVTIDRRLSAPVEVAAYYVVAEALTNAAKHSHASQVGVRVETQDGNLRLLIQDDGIGGAKSTKGSGLIGLKDRVEALAGDMQISSPPGSGTSLYVTIPLDG